jgi:hypothetical protein
MGWEAAMAVSYDGDAKPMRRWDEMVRWGHRAVCEEYDLEVVAS